MIESARAAVEAGQPIDVEGAGAVGTVYSSPELRFLIERNPVRGPYRSEIWRRRPEEREAVREETKEEGGESQETSTKGEFLTLLSPFFELILYCPRSRKSETTLAV